MKKMLLGVCLIVILVLTGCVSTKMSFVYDTSIPEEEMSFLWISNLIKITKFGDKAVEWQVPALLYSAKVGVPAGEFTFVFETVENNMPNVPVLRNQSFTNNFEKGKAYQVVFQRGEFVLVELK